ncbi:hypothetical protein RS130_13200 [Paraglaciecola aquimarina]|uniref:Lipoprotein n=1 Tax=Paraglaciecola aquimarina TaxID=1235557 RepID=A0ABU3SXL8_9ALTE|nr:hypothetical protein [Paraglaciecola aquimarina]MDU0354744.1 hypothetical protein [Paraglaciecola aquimarina]
MKRLIVGVITLLSLTSCAKQVKQSDVESVAPDFEISFGKVSGV